MAKQTTVTLVDDLDGTVADESVEFAIDGRSYEIDLSTSNTEKLRSLLDPYLSAARRAGRRSATSGTTPAAPGRATSDREHNQAIREWAQAQGLKISERGRIPTNVLDSYRESH